jgi:Uma2 family endonuclease
MSVVASPETTQRATLRNDWSLAPGQRVLLPGIRWRTYEALLEDLGDRHIRLTYDRGSLEIRAPLFRHESYAGVLGRLVEVLAEHLNLPFKSGWSTTFRRQDLEKGLEPDRCFYIRNVRPILGKLEIDLSQDPPPDLAIEIDITHSSLDRIGIYASLRVPEVWSFDGTNLRVHCLQTDGTYRTSQSSSLFPTLPLSGVTTLVQQIVGIDDLSQIRTLRTWLREHVTISN